MNYNNPGTTRTTARHSDDRPIVSSGKYNLDFIDYNNEFERIYDIGFSNSADELTNSSRIHGLNVPFGMGEETFNRLMLQELQTIEEESKPGLPDNHIECIKRMKMGISSKTCSVCFSEFKKNEIIRCLPCEHIFHEKCLLPWFKTNVTCPNCRFDLLQYFSKNPN